MSPTPTPVTTARIIVCPTAALATAQRPAPTDLLISAVAPLAEGPSWFDRLYRHEPNLMKVILRP